MSRQVNWLRLVSWGISLALLLTAGPGCLVLVNPIESLPKDEKAEILQIPPCCKNRVYIFFFQGMDPVDICNLEGVRDYVQSLGFIKTYFGAWTHHRRYFANEIIRIHKEDPYARFVVVGFSYGANAAREVANRVGKEDITVDLLFYLGGNTLDDSINTRPPNVLRIVNILATGWIWNGTDIEGAENVQLTDVWHFGSPAHPHSTDLLARELAVVAQRVPIVARDVPPPLDEGPRPRAITPIAPAPQQQRPRQAPSQQSLTRKVPGQQASPKEDWDFLQPDSVESPRGPAPGHLASYVPTPKSSK